MLTTFDHVTRRRPRNRPRRRLRSRHYQFSSQILAEEVLRLLPRVLGGGRVVFAAGGIREGVVGVVRVELVLHARLGEGLVELLYFVRRDPAVLVRPDPE